MVFNKTSAIGEAEHPTQDHGDAVLPGFVLTQLFPYGVILSDSRETRSCAGVGNHFNLPSTWSMPGISAIKLIMGSAKTRQRDHSSADLCVLCP